MGEYKYSHGVPGVVGVRAGFSANKLLTNHFLSRPDKVSGCGGELLVFLAASRWLGWAMFHDP